MSHIEISNLIVGGDWNVTLQAIDKKGGTPWWPTLYRNKLVSIMDDIGLIDVFRQLYGEVTTRGALFLPCLKCRYIIFQPSLPK